jgi:hypothetical protein
MNSTKNVVEPKLDKPGAGLPLIELTVAKYIMFPLAKRSTTPEKAIALFSEETEKILALTNSLKHESMTERTLIPRLRGLEDSSRFWSVAMAVEHLVIVGNGIRQVILDLSSSGATSRQPRGTADVKPNPAIDPETAITSFRQMSEQFLLDTKTLDVNKFPAATFPHPWFGPLNAHGWLTLSGMHQQIHRKHIQEIIIQLG